MKNIFTSGLMCVVVMASITCTKDPVDPNDFRGLNEPKDNTYILRDGTYAMSPEDQADLLSYENGNVIFASSSAFGSAVVPGDIMVNPYGGENGFILRVESVSADQGQIRMTTIPAQMTDAFSYWVIDSRTDKLTIKTRSGFTETYNFEEEFAGVDFTFGGTVDPQFTVTPSYDDYELIYRWDEDDPAYTNGPYIELSLDNFKIRVEGKVVCDFSAGFSLSAEPERPFTITQIPYANFLTLYVSPKMELAGGFEGTFTTPTLGVEVGPYNVSCGFDNISGELFWYDLPDNAITPLVLAPTIENLSGEVKPIMGVEFIIAPTGLYESGFNDVAEAKLSLFGYQYMNYLFQHRGSFSDPQPRIAFDAQGGFGFNFGVEFNLFDGLITEELASDDFEWQWFQWNLANVNTCDAFPSAGITYTGGQVDVDIEAGANHGLGYQIYVNDSLFSDQVYGYNQTNTIDLPGSSQLVNKISITDVNSLGCYLEDIYVDPSLVGNCSDKFVDPRDGNEYCYTNIGGLTWMAENVRFTNGGTIGKWYNNAVTDENLIYGRLYTFDEIGSICPDGWHIPTNVEWTSLINALGGTSQFGKNAKAASNILWPGSQLPDETTFGAVPSGEYYSWLEGSTQYAAYGNKGKYARFWSSSLLDGAPTMIEISAGNLAEVNTGESANLIGLSQFKSIREIGFSCRCVQD